MGQLVNPTIATAGTTSSALDSIGYAAPAYQLGIGNQYAQAQPFDLYITPTSGTSITPLTSLLLINGTGTITALTVVFPNNAVNGQRLKIATNQTISTLTTTAGTGSNGTADTITSSFSGALTVSTTFGISFASVEWVYQMTPATNATTTTALNTWYRIS